jgi:hypothetical protein
LKKKLHARGVKKKRWGGKRNFHGFIQFGPQLGQYWIFGPTTFSKILNNKKPNMAQNTKFSIMK